jgi:ASC-1-like (ASCH) protein
MIELAFEDAHFQDIKSGKKTTIGKIDADLQGIKKGDTVIFFKDVGKKDNSSEKVSVKVRDIKKFSDVPTMLKEMKLKTILPHSRTYKDGEKVFEETYGEKLKDAKFTAFTFDILGNTIKVPKGTVLRVTANSNSKEPVINFQPENEAELHMQERHERFNRDSHRPRIKDKKNGKNSEPRIKKKKNGENSDSENDENDENNNVDSNVFGPRIKKKKNGEISGPRIKNKKNGEMSGPRIKNKKNGEMSGPRIKDKKNGEMSGPRIKDKKNGENYDLNNNSNRPSREFDITISEPWFSLIENGQKTVEGRLFKGIFTEFRVNDTIRFINKWNGKEKSVKVKITKLTKYPNFGDLLFNEKLYKVLPGFPNIKCGIVLYDRLYNFNNTKEYGTLAIELKVN